MVGQKTERYKECEDSVNIVTTSSVVASLEPVVDSISKELDFKITDTV